MDGLPEAETSGKPNVGNRGGCQLRENLEDGMDHFENSRSLACV